MGCNASKPKPTGNVSRVPSNQRLDSRVVTDKAKSNVSASSQNIQFQNGWDRPSNIPHPDKGAVEAATLLFSKDDQISRRFEISNEVAPTSLIGKIIPMSELSKYEGATVYGLVSAH